jgi:hypothetical protein
MFTEYDFIQSLYGVLCTRKKGLWGGPKWGNVLAVSVLRTALDIYPFNPKQKRQNNKTINSQYSLVVTHPTTNRPVHGLSTAERTGRPVFHVLWSIAEVHPIAKYIEPSYGVVILAT